MASDKPPVPREDVDHQDPSIKDRKSQLFEQPTDAASNGTVKPFADYVRDVPPAPLSPGVKMGLWALAVVVLLLFLSALLFGRGHATKKTAGRDFEGRAVAVA